MGIIKFKKYILKMAFVKIVKNKAYSKRMQVKPKRRRQGKTDYYARRRLTCQRKNKYDSKKYRLVVRRTCTRVISQIIYSTMTGDKVLCTADSRELKGMGLTAGLTNYSAHYCTGLLLARRLLKQVGLADEYKATDKIDGAIQRTTTGARIFGVLKGACDGGLNVPHTVKRFPGYTRSKVEIITNKRGKTTDTEKQGAKYDAKVHKDRIFGAHVTAYMNTLKKEDAEKYKMLFSQWDKCLKANTAKPTRKVVTDGFNKVFANSKGKKWLRQSRISKEQRTANVQAKFAAALAAQGN